MIQSFVDGVIKLAVAGDCHHERCTLTHVTYVTQTSEENLAEYHRFGFKQQQQQQQHNNFIYIG